MVEEGGDPVASVEEDLRMTTEESTAVRNRIRDHQHRGRERPASPENQERDHQGRIARDVLCVTTEGMTAERRGLRKLITETPGHHAATTTLSDMKEGRAREVVTRTTTHPVEDVEAEEGCPEEDVGPREEEEEVILTIATPTMKSIMTTDPVVALKVTTDRGGALAVVTT